MKTLKKLFSLLLVLCLLLSLSITALAASYSGSDVVPGLSGIQPGDELTHPDNTDWATLTASWGVRVTFVDWDESELKSEVVPVTDTTSGSSSAPADPTRTGYTFTGWERHDTTSGTATLNDDGTVTGVNGPGPIVFIAKYTKNVEPIPTYGNLAISKNVTGDLGDKTKYFTFKVEFNVDGAFNYTGSKTGTITSGGTVQLKHGESITIVDIPAGTSYTVTESGNSGYSVYASGDTGIISDGKTSNAKFTNTISSVPKTGDNSNMPLWFSLMGISVLGMIGTLFIKTKKRRIGTHLRNK